MCPQIACLPVVWLERLGRLGRPDQQTRDKKKAGKAREGSRGKLSNDKNSQLQHGPVRHNGTRLKIKSMKNMINVPSREGGHTLNIPDSFIILIIAVEEGPVPLSHYIFSPKSTVNDYDGNDIDDYV